MENLEQKYIENSLRVIKTYIESLSSILANMHADKEPLDMNSLIFLKMDTINYKNELKLSLLSTLFSNNYDSIILTVDDEIKRKVIENEPIYKAITAHAFEDGSIYDIGAGLRITKINDKIKNNYNKILILIRNSIAHSKFVLNEDKITVKNRDFEATIDIKWLEMMTLVVFSNSNVNDKKGANDGMLLLQKTEFMSINSEKELRDILKNSNYLNITYKKDQNIYMTDLISVVGQTLAKYERKIEMMMALKILSEKYEDSFKSELLTVDGSFIKMMNHSQYFFYNLDVIRPYYISKSNALINRDYATINENTYEKQLQILADLYAAYTDKEKRNTIAYKNILEFINLLENNKITSLNMLDSNVLFFINIMYQALIKAYCNIIFNYFTEKNKDAEIDILNNLKTQYSIPNYVNFRKKEIAKLRGLLNNNLGGNEPIKIETKINRLIKEIEDYKLGRTDINELLIDKFRNAFVHGQIEFSPINDVREVTIRDYEDNIQNFKLKINSADLLELADNIYKQFHIEKVKTLTNK